MRGHRWSCAACDAVHALDSQPYTCDCPAAGRLGLDLSPGTDRLRPSTRDGTLWRYGAVLPIDPGSPAALRVRARYPAGGTPLRRADRLAGRFGLARLWIKDESANPTGSLKDRASALVVAAALEHGHRVVATASSGNAAAALAGAAAACEVRCVVLVPARVTANRLAQLAGYGADVLVVDGDYDTAVRLSFAACDEFGWYCRTTAVNPYTTQGKKTAALEIVEQLGWRSPDAVVVATGDGNILTGIHAGLRDALSLGWIDRLPRLFAVQAAGADPVYRAWRDGTTVAAMTATTAADGICVGYPLDGDRAVSAVRSTGGAVVTVDDDEMAQARTLLAAEGDTTAELSSAAAAAALPLLRARGLLRPADEVVLVNTGGRRLPVDAAGRETGRVTRVAADLAAVAAATGDVPAASGGRRRPRLSGVSVT